MYSKDLLKGTLSTILLKLLASQGKMYGYEIAQKVKILSSDRIILKEGSLYPALHKLKDDGFVRTEKEMVDNRVRKYYSLTNKGKTVTREKVDELSEFARFLQKVVSIKTSME
jgi:DNA-binding PadR family transcriptional regulator